MSKTANRELRIFRDVSAVSFDWHNELQYAACGAIIQDSSGMKLVIFVAALSQRSCLAYEGAGAKQVYY